ncbi:hypothetical protein JCM10207_001236 [Rhodosporidiobolus poonsookiae]
MASTPPDPAPDTATAPGLFARSTAALSTAWQFRTYIPVIASTVSSYYLFGPPHATWPLRLALFTAVARFHSSAAVAARELEGKTKELSEEEQVRIMQATRRKVEGLLVKDPERQPRDGQVREVEVPVRKRGLGGVLREVDGEEDGTRMVKAEWSAHHSLLTSSAASSDQRILLYTHGGAYTLLSTRTHRQTVLQLSKQLGCKALFNAYLYLTQDLNIPASSILLGGDSAGGNLALALMLYLRDEGLPQVGGAVLVSPWVDMTASLGSWDENKDFDYLTVSPSDPLSPPRLFLPSVSYPTLLSSPYVSPALTASFTSLPSLLIQSGGAETLRDEHALLALRASRDGVRVTHEVYREGVHVHQMVDPGESAREAMRAVGEWGRGLPPAPSGAADKLQEVDQRLKAAWDARPAAEKAAQREEGTSARRSAPARFMYERVAERVPPLKLREGAHEAAKKAVAELDEYEPPEGLTTVVYARRVPAEGVVGRVRGLLHL